MSSESQRISCPKCQAKLKVVAAPGEAQTCPQCGTKFLPPARDRPAAATDPNAEWDDLFGPSSSAGAAQPAQSAPTKTPPPPVSKTDAAPKPSPPTVVAKSAATVASPSTRPALADDQPLPFDDAHDDDDLRLAAPVDAPQPKLEVAELADRFTFSVACRVCGTLIDCLSTEIGRTVQCPDCHSKFVVPPPRDAQTRTPASQNPLATGQIQELAPAPLPHGEASLQQPDVLRASAASLLAKAKAEQDEIDRRQDDMGEFDNSKAADIVRFLLDPAAIVRLIAIAVLGMVALTLIRWSLPLFASDSTNFFGSLALLGIMTLAAPVAAAWLVGASAHAMALFRDTAAGQVKVAWPDVNIFDWLGQGLYVILAALYSGLPGAMLAAMMISAEVHGIYALLVVMCSWVALFPLTFVSMAHEVSWAGLVSLPVYRSLRDLRGPWIIFYQASLLLGLMTWGLLSMALASSALAVPFVVSGVTMLGAFYFRVLGWVAGQLGAVLAPEDDQDDQGDKPQQPDQVTVG